jgi:hypothetical protein
MEHFEMILESVGMLSAKKTLKPCGSWNLPHVEKYRL